MDFRFNDDLMLVKLTTEYLSQIWEYKAEFLENGDSMDGTGPLRKSETPEEYYGMVQSYLSEETLPEGLVLATQFLCVRKSDNRLVGMLQARHYLNDYLRQFAGHIGYSVRPSERRKGYAEWMLHNVLPFFKSIGVDSVMVTCNDYNEGSRRTILRNGGVYEGTAFCEEDNEHLEKYRIDIDKERR
ncbi:MAG: GNAT family N-acetyltransferase [Lachnospiraceae bacterium]|nr:GNAT family N-acetyltransferase [Lachnospiraceae bacterium]